jgi:hypothetical protein
LGAAPNDTLQHSFDLLVEPTLACELSCACCIRKNIIGKGRNQDGLDVEVYRRLIKAAANEKYRLNQVHYIGWGEPLLHPHFRELVDIAYASFPNTVQMATTTGNVDFRSTIGEGRFDHIVLSCDGTKAASYEKYRKGGDFNTAMRFAADAKSHGHDGLRIEWKYILFEFNDSDEEVLQAQRMADETGVDRLVFIMTNSKWKSVRFHGANASTFPIISSRAQIIPAAALGTFIAEGGFQSPLGSRYGYIDRIGVSVGQFLMVEGWSLNPNDGYTDRVELWIDGELRSQSFANMPRNDVVEARPNAAGSLCGFQFNIPFSIHSLPEEVEIRSRSADGDHTMGGRLVWSELGDNEKVRKDLRLVL